MIPDRWLGRAKRPLEEFPIAWDFVNDITAGDTVTAVGGGGSAITAVDATTGADTSSLLQGPNTSGTSLRVQVQAGTAGATYHVTFKAVTANGDVFQRIVGVRMTS